MQKVCCTVCGSHAMLYDIPRFPTVKPCWSCIARFQLRLTQLMGKPFVQQMYVESFIFSFCNEAHWLVESNTATFLPRLVGYQRENP